MHKPLYCDSVAVAAAAAAAAAVELLFAEQKAASGKAFGRQPTTSGKGRAQRQGSLGFAISWRRRASFFSLLWRLLREEPNKGKEGGREGGNGARREYKTLSQGSSRFHAI